MNMNVDQTRQDSYFVRSADIYLNQYTTSNIYREDTVEAKVAA